MAGNNRQFCFAVIPLSSDKLLQLSNRIRELEDRKSNIDESTQTTQAETTDTKEDSGKEDKVLPNSEITKTSSSRKY